MPLSCSVTPLTRTASLIPLAALAVLVLAQPSAPALAQASASASVPLSPRVEEIRILKPGAGRVDWSVQGDWLAYDRMGTDGFYDVYLYKPEGDFEKCLTCDLFEFRKDHAMDPAWHPSGKLIAFQGQSLARKMDLKDAAKVTTPDRGLRGDLWLIDREGKLLWRLRPGEQTGGAVLEPHFSHEGGLVLWSERVTTRGGLWGEWVLRVARFDADAKVPRLRKVETLEPGGRPGFRLGHGFSGDDRRVLLSGNLEPGQEEGGLDVYSLDHESGTLVRLTATLGELDQNAHVSPDGESIAFTSNRNLARRRQLLQATTRPSARAVRRELWIMNVDGRGAERLTYFNDPASPESVSGATVSDLAWSPEGDRIALHVVTDFVTGREAVYLLRLAQPIEVSEPVP